MRERRLTTQIVIRVDPQLRGALELDAACSGRTLAQSARFYLDAAMNGVVCDRCGAALERRARGDQPCSTVNISPDGRSVVGGLSHNDDDWIQP